MENSPTPPQIPANAPTPKKGMHPLAWVGIGCGGLIVIALIGGALMFKWGKGKFDEIADGMTADPERAAARTVVGMHPHMELVAEDEEAGQMTVRFTRSGEELTVGYGEIAEGTLEFTASDGTVTTLGQGDLADLPKWVPRYPGAENEVVVYQRGEGSHVRGLLSFSSADSPAVVGDFYEARMKDLGSHHGSSHTNLSFGSTSQSKRAISVDGKEIRLTATASSESDPTRVQVIYEAR